MYGASMTYSDSKIIYQNVLTVLGMSRPIFCYLSTAKSTNPNKGTNSHAIVLCGTYKLNGNVYYVYMDPNKASQSEYVVNSISAKALNETGTYFYYSNGNYNSNNWVKAWY